MLVVGLLSSQNEANEIKDIAKICELENRIRFIVRMQKIKDLLKQEDKILDVLVAYGEKIEKDRFYLYAEVEKINMWVLYDHKEKCSHFLMKEDAETRITEILNEK